MAKLKVVMERKRPELTEWVYMHTPVSAGLSSPDALSGRGCSAAAFDLAGIV
jgi:hypothetical protein